MRTQKRFTDRYLEDFLDHTKKLYTGTLGPARVEHGFIFTKAYRVFWNQTARCTNKNCRAYKTYGNVGIKVHYSIREFVYWFLKNYPIRGMHHPSVGRKNHSVGYTLENIEFQSKSSNSSERVRRLGTPTPRIKVSVFDSRTHNLIRTFSSYVSAAKFFNMSHATVRRHALGGESRFGVVYPQSNKSVYFRKANV